jgi:hypothetical protein
VDGLDVLAVRDGLAANGWQTSVTLDPPGFQVMLNAFSGEIVEPFAEEIAEVIGQVRSGKIMAARDDLEYGV